MSDVISKYAVDREEVNDILGHCIQSQEDYYLAIKMLYELPPVKQEPKTGHWIYDPKTDLSICDKCGSYCPHDEHGRFETNFCHYCGARMVEQKESEEV